MHTRALLLCPKLRRRILTEVHILVRAAQGMPSPPNAMLQAEIANRTKKNLGVFSVPQYNHSGDPFDKYGQHQGYNRLMPSLRNGLQGAHPHGFWKEVVSQEGRATARATGANAGPPPPPLSFAAAPAPPPAAAAAPPGVMPPGWYYVPAVGADGKLRPTLTYVPYAFAVPPAA